MTDLLASRRVDFHPVVDLDAGAVVAIEAVGGTATADPETDIAQVLDAVRAANERESLLPLQITIGVWTALDMHAMGRLHHALLEMGRRPRSMVLNVSGPFEAAGRLDIATTLMRIREAGYLLGVDGATSLPVGLIAEVTPYLIRMEPEISRRTASDPRCAAAAESLVSLARGIGAHVLAPGIVSDDQLSHVRSLGIRLVQGPLLAPGRWRPGMPVSVPVVSPRIPLSGSLGPRVSEFVLPAATLPETVTAGQVLTALHTEPRPSSIVLVDERLRPRHSVDRTRFLLRIAGAYGYALYAKRPAALLADPPRPIPQSVPAIAALRTVAGDPERAYDDLVIVDEGGRCLGIARVADLIKALADDGSDGSPAPIGKTA